MARVFADNPGLDLLSGAAAAPSGGRGSGRWHPVPSLISRANVWITAISGTLFLRHVLLDRIGGFDERLGLGAVYGAAEETDLVVRAIDSGGRAEYDPRLRVVHPDKRLTTAAVARARSYGLGCGFVLGKHRFGWPVRTTFLVRPLGGLLRGLLRGRSMEMRYYSATFLRAAHWAAGGNPRFPSAPRPHVNRSARCMAGRREIWRHATPAGCQHSLHGGTGYAAHHMLRGRRRFI